MPQPLDEKKRGAVIRIISSKLKNGENYDEMKRYNSEEALRQDDQEVKDSASTAAAEAIIRAFETRNAKDLKVALKNFLEMVD